MRLWILAALSWICVSCSSTPPAARPAPEDPLDSIVAVRVHNVDGTESDVTGFVRRDGCVVSPLYSLSSAARVTVRTRGGRACGATGISGYHSDAGIALLVVEWEDQSPPGLDVAPTVATAGTALRLVSTENRTGNMLGPVEMAAGSPDTIEVTTVWPAGLNIASAAAGVALDGAGRAAGVLTSRGVNMILVPSPGVPEANLQYARPEVIGALRPDEAIPWTAWREVKRERIDRVRDMAGEMRKLNKAESWEKLVAAAQEATALDAGSWTAWVYLGWGLSRVDRWQEAEAAYFRAESLTPTDARSIGARSVALVHLGRVEDAVRVSARVVALAPDNPGAWGTRAWVLERAGQIDKAIGAYTTELRLDPNSREARRGLERLGGQRDGASSSDAEDR